MHQLLFSDYLAMLYQQQS